MSMLQQLSLLSVTELSTNRPMTTNGKHVFILQQNQQSGDSVLEK